MVDEEWISNPQQLKDAFFNYYNGKFQPIESHFDVNINPGFTALCPNEALDLQKPASLEEIRNAVWDCGSGLRLALDAATHSQRIKRVKNGDPNLIFSHFFFADDVVILTEWDRNDLENITRLLHSFYLASGLKLNISKLNLYGVVVSEVELQSMAQLTGCQIWALHCMIAYRFRMALTASFAADNSMSWATVLYASDLSILIGIWLALSW
ncbi:hypothetical protein Tco_0206065 [Tanacetum coccineum]